MKDITDEDILAVHKMISEAPVPTAMRFGIDKDGKRVVQFTDYKSQPIEPCDHQNTEHHASGDIHDRSLPYTECLDCGIEIDTEPLYPEDKE